jgi:hypothetical protein
MESSKLFEDYLDKIYQLMDKRELHQMVFGEKNAVPGGEYFQKLYYVRYYLCRYED